MVPYPAKTYRRFLICIAAPSKRATGAAAIFCHFSSGAGKSAKVADKTLPAAVLFFWLSPPCKLHEELLIFSAETKINYSFTCHQSITGKYSTK